MKYKLIGISACLLGILAVAANQLLTSDKIERYHQHLREPGYTACEEHGDERFCSHLPLVFIETGGQDIPGVALSEDGTPLGEHASEEYELDNVTMAADGRSTISCHVTVVDNPEGNNHPGDQPALESRAEFRIRGNTSRYLDKKGYLLKTTQDDDRDEKREVPMLGMPAHDEWALHGPYRDKTLIRNYLSYNLAGEIMDYAPEVRFCEVFIDGGYQGLYLMMETITNGTNCRARLTEPEDDLSEVSYIVRVDRGSSNPVKNIRSFTEYSLRVPFQKDIVYPGTANLTPERIEYIRQDLSSFEKALYSYDYDSELYGWRALADRDSFVNYFLIHEFSGNYELGARSTYIYRDVRGKFGAVLWDFDGAFGNIGKVPYTDGFESQYVIWLMMMFKDPEFVNGVIDRYYELRQGCFSEEWLYQYIDDTVEWLGPAIERDLERWGYNYEEYRPLRPDSRNPDSYEDSIVKLKEYIHQRGLWMDENIESLRQYCADSKVKKFIENAN